MAAQVMANVGPLGIPSIAPGAGPGVLVPLAAGIGFFGVG